MNWPSINAPRALLLPDRLERQGVKVATLILVAAAWATIDNFGFVRKPGCDQYQVAAIGIASVGM